MRVTNGMLVNTTLTGLYNNMNAMNKTYAQMTTGKKIQTVSDDPIIAGRALKLKSSVLENEQYESNTKEATSWMEITEGALTNMHDILETIRTKCVEAANGTLEKEDKEVIKDEINELLKQLQEEANVSYSGRYVFSGYKTSEPLVLTTATKLEEDRQLAADLYLSGEVKIEEDTLTHTTNELAAEKGSVLGKGTVLGENTTLAKDTVLQKGTILSKEDAVGLGLLTADEAANLEGEVYTLTEEKKIPDGGYTTQKEITLGEKTELLEDTTLGKGTTLAKGTTLKEGSILAKGTTLPAGILNPAVNGNINGQSIQYEIGVNSTISVNTLKMDEVFSNMIQTIGELSSNIEASLEDESVTTEQLYELFNNKLEVFDGLLGDVSKATTDLGARMSRVEYVQNRLVDQKTTLKSLLSDTEDIDIEEVYVNFNTQYAAYQSALQATSKIITNTLADYL